jgi:hypothetical protein
MPLLNPLGSTEPDSQRVTRFHYIKSFAGSQHADRYEAGQRR